MRTNILETIFIRNLISCQEIFMLSIFLQQYGHIQMIFGQFFFKSSILKTLKLPIVSICSLILMFGLDYNLNISSHILHPYEN